MKTLRIVTRRLWGRERGFTLPEVMIVIALMSILAAIATPVWWNIVESRAVDSATNQLVSDMRLAHTRASNQLTDWAIVSDPTSVGAAAGVVPAGSWDYYLVRIPQPPAVISSGDITGRELGEDDRAQIATSTPVNVRFKPNGQARAANDSELPGPLTITVHKNGGSIEDTARHDIELIPDTSRVEIDPPAP